MTARCANTEALDRHMRDIDRADRLRDEAEEDLYKRIDPIIQELKSVMNHHVRFNDAGMDHADTRNYILETLGELL